MKNHFRLEFQCKELEQKYQKYQEQIIITSFNTYTNIIMLTNAIICIQHVLKSRWVELIFNIFYAAFHFSYRNIINRFGERLQYTIPIYFILFSASSSIYQLWIFMFAKYDQSEIDVGLDICFQLATQFTITGNHIHSTLLYCLFLIIRVYIQVSRGFNYMQIGFIFYGFQYMFNEFQKAKTTRKLFLASEHNNLQKLILDDFVSDSIFIFEYDNEQPKFTQQYVNKSGEQFIKNHNYFKIMNEILVLKGRISIQEYVYKKFLQTSTRLNGKFEESCYLQSSKLKLIVSGFIQNLEKQILVIKIKNFKTQCYKYDSIYINLLKKLQKNLSYPVIKKIFQQQLIKIQLKNIISHKYKIQLQQQEVNEYQLSLILRKIFNYDLTLINYMGTIHTDVGLFSILLYLIKKIVLVNEIQIYCQLENGQEEYFIIQFKGKQIVFNKKFDRILMKIQQILYIIGSGEPLFNIKSNILTLQIQLLRIKTSRFGYLKNN